MFMCCVRNPRNININCVIIAAPIVSVARLQTEVGTKNVSSYEISDEKCSEIFPKCLGLYFVGPKNPAKFPPNFPLNLPANIKTKFIDELLQGAQGQPIASC